MKWVDFLYVGTNLGKLKVSLTIFGWWWSKMVVGLVVLVTLKSAVSQESVDEVSWFFVCWYKFRKAKSFFNNFWVVVVKNGCGLLGLVTLKSALSQESVDEVSWFFVCWYKFRKAKSFFNNFWVVVVKNGCGSCSSCDSKICCISRIRWWSELIFCMLIQI